MEMLAQCSISCPTSPQLRLAMNGRHHGGWKRGRQFYAGWYRTRIAESHVVWSPLEIGNGNCWTSTCSKDGFAGWEDTNGRDWAGEGEEKKGLGGAASVGLAGLLLVFAGIAFIGLRLNKKSYSKPKLILEPLTAEHEVMLGADKDESNLSEFETSENNEIQHASHLKSNDEPNDPISSASAAAPKEAVTQSDQTPESDVTLKDNAGDGELDSSYEITEIKGTPAEDLTEKDEEYDFESSESLQSQPKESMPIELDMMDNSQTLEKERFFTSSDVPAPTFTTALQLLPEKVLVPATIDEAQGQALAALQALKVIAPDVKPTDICSRRQYARWLVASSGSLSRNLLSKVYPATYIEDDTVLAFDDVTPDDPDFPFIQGLAEAGLISSKLSARDLLSTSGECQESVLFYPESPLCRQDLVCWKMALESRQLPEADKKMLYQLSGFRDIDRINPDAWPSIVADLSSGDLGIISLAFGFTRLFQPEKQVTNAQAAVALATGEFADVVNEELARIAAESAAEDAVAAHNELVAQVEKEINASFQKELEIEREKTNVVEKKIAELVRELDLLRSEREENNISLMKERTAIESELDVLSKLRREAENQLENLLSDKVTVSYMKERISKLQSEIELEKEEISKLQYDLDVERKALSIARNWAEDEANRAREQAKALELARERWERQGIKVVVDDDLREEAVAAVVSLPVGSVEDVVARTDSTAERLKRMAASVVGRSKEVIEIIVQKLYSFVVWLKKGASRLAESAGDVRNAAVLKVEKGVGNIRGSLDEMRRSTGELSSAVMENTKRAVDDCRDGLVKMTHKFKF